MELVSQARAGFATVDADPALKDRALANLTAWLTQPDFAAYRPQLEWLVTSGKWSVLVDSFYQVMPFGTGGRRGAVGIGPNRMNLWTLGASVQGHSEYLKERFPDAAGVHVALAYDVRRFMDNGKKYAADRPREEAHREGRKRENLTGERTEGGKEKFGNDERGGRSVEEEIVPLDRGADRAGDHRLDERALLGPR